MKNYPPKKKWYLKPSSFPFTFLLIGPFMLPFVWFTPHLSRNKKIVISVIILIFSYFLLLITLRALRPLSLYYKVISGKIQEGDWQNEIYSLDRPGNNR